VIGIVAGPAISPNMTKDDAAIAAGAIGAILGSVILATVAASDPPKQIQTGVSGAFHNPEFP
jgi:hypothetical protein